MLNTPKNQKEVLEYIINHRGLCPHGVACLYCIVPSHCNVDRHARREYAIKTYASIYGSTKLFEILLDTK
jgi:hypothetical protein